MKVQKTIKAKIIKLTNRKQELLSREYENFQLALNGRDVKLYSATKQQAQRLKRRLDKGYKPEKKYPLIIRNDTIRVEQKPTKITKYWAKIPVYGQHGGVWVAIKPHCDILPEYSIRETKLKTHKGNFFLHITVQKEVEIKEPEHPDKLAIISCDLGEANPVTSVMYLDSKITPPEFYGREIRGIRATYTRVRKQIGKRKVKHALRVIRQIGQKESRIVKDKNHKISREIVNKAVKLREQGYEPVIVIGKLKGVRKSRRKWKTRCRKNNRKLHSMASYQMTSFITYKANWEGIPVALQEETWTSQICHRCGAIGERKGRYFRCHVCGLECNADGNGAINICNRFLGQWLRNRGLFDNPITPTVDSVSGNRELLEIQNAMGESPKFI